MDWKKWQLHFQLLNPDGLPIPYQVLQSEALAPTNIPALLFRVTIEPGEMTSFRIGVSESPRVSATAAVAPDGVDVLNGALRCRKQVKLVLGDAATITSDDESVFHARYELIEDSSDTWSHGLDRYASSGFVTPVWSAAMEADRGPLSAAIVRSSALGHSEVREDWRVFAGEKFADLRLRILWCEKGKILKLAIPLPHAVIRRTDGIMGESLVRQADGAERPVRDWILLELEGGMRIGVVMPDVFAVDVSTNCVRLTLLRSCLLAHHEPFDEPTVRGTYSDHGAHDFRFRIFTDRQVTADVLEHQAMMLQRPLAGADLTRGMHACLHEEKSR